MPASKHGKMAVNKRWCVWQKKEKEEKEERERRKKKEERKGKRKEKEREKKEEHACVAMWDCVVGGVGKIAVLFLRAHGKNSNKMPLAGK